ncbi:unnamed protein product [Ceratitis capitata]|uniref:(Mediterranean fruit fly) hypothetical protein n=1 Tax=Ceratitis capitata TaxID=7213 RepID=A0A811V4T2_CERCA|nr:unnamed protein product [Ceratitis capitata]
MTINAAGRVAFIIWCESKKKKKELPGDSEALRLPIITQQQFDFAMESQNASAVSNFCGNNKAYSGETTTPISTSNTLTTATSAAAATPPSLPPPPCPHHSQTKPTDVCVIMPHTRMATYQPNE